jgi:hypothetical protein
MKKLIFLLLIPFTLLLISACDDETVAPPEPGSIYITSIPAGAQIWIDGDITSFTTPDTVTNVDAGSHEIILRLENYNDTTFTLSVIAGEMSVVGPITLVANITLYGLVRIYETQGTDPITEPSGLDLSTGMAYGVSSSNNGLVDIYYSTDGTGGQGYLVQSADLYGTLVRETDFYVGSGTNLFDGEDSPLSNTGTWTNNMGDRETNYVYLYDHDGHYSKLKIVNFGGGTIQTGPAWVEVQWYYNETELNNHF